MATYKDALQTILRSRAVTRRMTPFRRELVARLRRRAASGETLEPRDRFRTSRRMWGTFDERRFYRRLSGKVTHEIRGVDAPGSARNWVVVFARNHPELRDQLVGHGLYKTGTPTRVYKTGGPVRRDSFFKRHTP